MPSCVSQSLVAVSFAAAALVCGAQTSAPQYGVKESDVRTGSSIKHYVAEGSRIPINRTYAELTSQERALVNEYYERVEPGDEPPFPLEGLRPIHSAVAQVQQKLLVSGNLVLVASVAADGTVSEVKAIGSPSPEMTKAAASIILLSRFKPAVCKGEPCKMEFPFTFKFVVK